MIVLAIAWSLVINFLILLFALLFTCLAQWDYFAQNAQDGFLIIIQHIDLLMLQRYSLIFSIWHTFNLFHKLNPIFLNIKLFNKFNPIFLSKRFVIILQVFFFTHVCKEFCVVCSLSVKFPCSSRSFLCKLLSNLRHLDPLIYNERHEPTSRNVIHGCGKLNVSKLYKGEEAFGYTLLQSSLLCTSEKHTIVHCCSGCYAMLNGKKMFFPPSFTHCMKEAMVKIVSSGEKIVF